MHLPRRSLSLVDCSTFRPDRFNSGEIRSSGELHEALQMSHRSLLGLCARLAAALSVNCPTFVLCLFPRLFFDGFRFRHFCLCSCSNILFSLQQYSAAEQFSSIVQLSSTAQLQYSNVQCIPAPLCRQLFSRLERFLLLRVGMRFFILIPQLH